MVPFTSFATGTWSYGSPKLERYNGVSVGRDPGPGGAGPEHRPGDGRDGATHASKLPAGHRLRMDRHLAAGAAVGLAGAAALRALDPRRVPEPRRAVRELVDSDLGDHGRAARRARRARRGARRFSLENDVYFQVGLLTTIGLSAKNAILIVEFARDLEAQGKSAIDAAIEAAQLRLRPILMTSLAFVLGVLPLAIANGAGSGSENAVGRGVIGGMLSADVPRAVPDSDVLRRDHRQAVQAEARRSAGVVRSRRACDAGATRASD